MRKLLVAALLLLVFPAVAQANELVHWHRDWRPHHHVHRHHVHKHHHRHAKKTTVASAPMVAPVPSPTAAPTNTPFPSPQYMAFDDENCTPQDIMGEMQAHNANVLRYIVPANPVETYQGIACVDYARSQGIKTYLSIQFDPGFSTTQLQQYFASVIQAYGPQWAIAVGNEEPDSAAQYVDSWDTVEPVIAQEDPGALRVAGENFPWATTWDQTVLDSSLPGMQAYAEHCYNTNNGGLPLIPQIAAWAAADGVPTFCSEMAPATASNLPSFFNPETLSDYNLQVTKVLAASPTLEMLSYYVWPSIGACALPSEQPPAC